MSAPTGDDLQELGRRLLMLAEQGDTMTVAAVGEEFACGHGDASKMLDVLREQGKAVEESPGRWRGPMLDELDASPPASGRIVVSVPGPDEPDPDLASTPPDAGARARSTLTQSVAPPTPTVRLTMAIANALDAAALGQLVKAGIGEAESNDEAFVMEVLP